MKAIGFKTSLPIEDNNSFIEFETPKPTPVGRELLVKISAISVNPVDCKIRKNSAKDTVLDTPKVIGWDAVGTVEAVGPNVSLFKVGDRVYYAGDITKPGCNAEYQVIDERIVGRKPSKLTDSETVVIALTGLTAWETLFDRMRVHPEKDKNKTILIIGGAGGVGSIAIQLAKKVANLTVIATASRPETREWCKKLGADYVVDHRDIVKAVREAGFNQVDYIADFIDTNGYWNAIVELIKPQGHIVSITGSSQPIDLLKLKSKSVTFSWELMYTRSMFNTPDMEEQHRILNNLADLLQKGDIKTTLNHTIKGFNVDNLKKAHQLIESNKTIGKIAIEF